MLNILSRNIPPTERIITIEDAAELQLAQENLVRLETRPPNIEGLGAIRQRQLLINCLRMRPDRIILGEVRGEEAFDMLQAMNTGHEGSMATIHANTTRDA
jgi:pilus assembly protein CpaF